MSSENAGVSNAPQKPSYITQPGEPITQEEIEYYLTLCKNNLTKERTGHEMTQETVDRFRKFLEADDGKPFWMINLVREQKEPVYPDWWEGDREPTLMDCKVHYLKACAPISKKGGTQNGFGVSLVGDYVLTDDESLEPWDQFYLIGYPCRKSFMMLLTSDAYADAIVHKYAGDKDTQLIPVTGLDIEVKKVYEDHEPMTQEQVDDYIARCKANLTPERSGHGINDETLARIRKFLEEDDGKPFWMINLVRENDEPMYPEWWKGERKETVLECKQAYAMACAPIMMKSGSYPIIHVCKAESAVLTDDEDMEDWDQFYLVSYPSRESFISLLASDPYADAIVHKHAGDKNTQLIPVTTNEIITPHINTDVVFI